MAPVENTIQVKLDFDIDIAEMTRTFRPEQVEALMTGLGKVLAAKARCDRPLLALPEHVPGTQHD